MRKPFRTTIDEDILLNLKKTAIEQGCNVNDIIERLVLEENHQKYFEKNDNNFPNMTLGEKQKYLSRRIKHPIDVILGTLEVNSELRPINIIEIMCDTIAEIIISNYQWKKK